MGSKSYLLAFILIIYGVLLLPFHDSTTYIAVASKLDPKPSPMVFSNRVRVVPERFLRQQPPRSPPSPKPNLPVHTKPPHPPPRQLFS
ncbi:hypothetical protein TorRG33x02_249710 [Trema orientale]|uniref:Uncharacterized protein n=1 Tax=Trema orientale TaxID=63057 RepID=A0A2P5DJN1_TREOI|nr:hypothetical protein TorRG33x02_249710 [Trema orientale]